MCNGRTITKIFKSWFVLIKFKLFIFFHNFFKSLFKNLLTPVNVLIDQFAPDILVALLMLAAEVIAFVVFGIKVI
jgi:hypothetical protein